MKLSLFTAFISLMANPAFATVIEFNGKGEASVHSAVDYLSDTRHSTGIQEFLSQPVQWPERRKKYEPLISEAAVKYGLPEDLLHAMILTESHYDAFAESSAGAVGLMQLMPATATRFGVTNRRDAMQNINGGAAYITWLLARYEGNRTKALAAYNAGEGAVDKYNGVPPYKETKGYVERINHILGSDHVASATRY